MSTAEFLIRWLSPTLMVAASLVGGLIWPDGDDDD